MLLGMKFNTNYTTKQGQNKKTRNDFRCQAIQKKMQQIILDILQCNV